MSRRFLVGWPGTRQCVYGHDDKSDGKSLFADPMSLTAAQKKVELTVYQGRRMMIYELVPYKPDKAKR